MSNLGSASPTQSPLAFEQRVALGGGGDDDGDGIGRAPQGARYVLSDFLRLQVSQSN